MRVKISKPPPPAPTASAIGPCPTLIKIVGRPGTGSLPSTIAPPDHPRWDEDQGTYHWCVHAMLGLQHDFTKLYTVLPKSKGGGRVVRWCWVSFQCQGVLLIWSRVGQGPTALAVGAGWGCLDIFFSRLSFLFSFSLSLGDGPI